MSESTIAVLITLPDHARYHLERQHMQLVKEEAAPVMFDEFLAERIEPFLVQEAMKLITDPKYARE